MSGIPQLRPYQLRAVREASRLLGQGAKSGVIVASTGAGKGTIAVAMIVEAISRNLVVMFVVHRTEILIDIARRLREEWGVDRVSMITGDRPQDYDPGASIHLINIASARSRVLPKIDLLIEDEAHRVLAASYLSLRETLQPRWITGFTGTPVRLDRKPLCLAYDELLVASQPSELLRDGYLAPCKLFAPPEDLLPNVDDVKLRGGEFDAVQIAKIVKDKKLVGAIVPHWQRHADGIPTIVFAVDVEHSKLIVSKFIEAGIPAEHVDGDASQEQRRALMARVRSGATTVVSCCQLWIEGVDLPELKCAIQARPTMSITVNLQSVGRVFRPFNGMVAIVLDHAGNFHRFGHPQQDRHWSIDPPKRKKRQGGEAPSKRCECGAILPLGARVCPECGATFEPDKLTTVDGDLVEMTLPDNGPEAVEASKRREFERAWVAAYREGQDDAWVMRRFAKKFGDAPPRDWEPPPRPPSTDLEKRKWVHTMTRVAHQNGHPYTWVLQKYRNKFGEEFHWEEETKQLEAPKEEVPEEPRVDLEF